MSIYLARALLIYAQSKCFLRDNFVFRAIFEKLNIPIVTRMLDGSAARQRAIADNIANVNTPGYKTKDVNFVDILNSETRNGITVTRTHPRHIPINESGKSEYIEFDCDNSSELSSGLNNVNIDQEMVKSAENQLYYSATSKIAAIKFKALHTSIKGR